MSKEEKIAFELVSCFVHSRNTTAHHDEGWSWEVNESALTDARDGHDRSQSASHIFFVILSAFLTIVIVTGFVGNILILVIVSALRKQRTISSCYVASLAFADVVFLSTCGSLHIASVIVPALYLDQFPFPWKVFRAFRYLHLVSMGVTCGMLVALTIDRYLAIVHPLTSRSYRRKRNAVITSVTIWAGSIAFASVIFSFEEYFKPVILYAVIVVTEYLLPLLVIAGCDTVIVCTMWRSPLNLATISGSVHHRGQKNQRMGLLRMVITTVVVFAFCAGVHHAIEMYLEAVDEVSSCQGLLLDLTSNMLLFVNSALNPFIYGATNAAYANKLKGYLQVCRFPSLWTKIREILAYRRVSVVTSLEPDTRSIELSSIDV
ncbi:galanin receptor type 1-like [Diadema antillarum]|uniref:galanin receptor type 1-like n=1 Tax=Diadema antillarum TaxID=105358 RepID=UPI003A8C000C